MMRTIDLFAGCGGLSLGFQNAGFQIRAAFDNWKPALEVYRANFSHEILDLDLSGIEPTFFAQFEPQMIIGGAPCQDFSSAGKRDENTQRADLTVQFAEIVAAVRPEWFVMENVSRIIKSRILQESLMIFKNAGYGLTHTILNAQFYQVPQSRKRFFLIGKLKEEDNFLNEILAKKQSTKPMTVFDYLGADLNTEYYYRHPRSYQRRGIYSVHEPSPTIRGVNRPIPKTYVRHPQDACAPDGNVRPLTTRERGLIQTFPPDFQFFGGKTDLEQMIGNAVPVKLAEFVAECIREYKVNQQISSKQLTLKF